MIKKVEFELTWNDIHAALANYVKEKAEHSLELKEEEILMSFISFSNRDGETMKVETASVTIKKS